MVKTNRWAIPRSAAAARVVFRLAGLVIGTLLFPSVAGAADQSPAVLDNEHLCIEVETSHGTIARVRDKQGRIELTPAEDLADNFRLVLRTADKKNKVILGRNQKLSSFSRDDGTLKLAWNGPLADTEGGEQSLPVRMEIQLAGQSLEFRLFLQNDTPHRVAEAWYPLVGGLTRFGRGHELSETYVMLPTATPTIGKIAIPFGDVAIAYPGQGQMTMSYSSIYNPKIGRAMYFASHDPVARFKNYRFFEQSSPAGKDVFVCIQHAPFTAPGKAFHGSPVVLRFHQGTWQSAGPIYREWFTKTFGLMAPSRNWIRRQSFIQDTMFLLPEGTVNLTFKDIPRWAQDAHARGVNAVLISGWHRGGHDNGYPHYVPDPRLGTYDDLKRGLESCHRMGMRVYFFANYQQAMIESDWFKKELYRYVEMREDGGYGACGWGMGTLWARIGNAKGMTSVDPSFPAYREALLRQFLKLVEVGADGLHIDKMWPSPMNFNSRCQLSPDTSTWEGAIELTRQLVTEAKKINPDFAMSFEGNWDRMLEFCNAIWWVGNMSHARSVFPEMVETRGITSPYDYLGVNNAVRLSQVGLLGPLNYTRSVGWEPWKGLSDYIREVKRIQDRLSDAVFFGEVLGDSQVQLGREVAPGVEYNVFRSLKTGRRVCVLTNSGMEDHRQVIQGFSGQSGGRVRIHAPFLPSREAALPAEVIVSAERIAFVEELPATGDKNDAIPTQVRPHVPLVTSSRPIANGGFESGDFTGWTADPNWRVNRNTCGEYRGWEGKYFAWSGGQGEAATGRLKAKPFVLNSDGVRLLVAGWSAMPGSSGRTGNFVALKAADGTEIDRRSAPNSLAFVPILLDGSGHQGEKVYLEAVDDANGSAWSMFCIDDVRTIRLPPTHDGPLRPLPAFDEHASLQLDNERYRVEVSRTNGVITRLLDKTARLELIREPRLAGNFKFTLPLPGNEPWETTEANYVVGAEQSLSSHELHGHTLMLRWGAPMKSRTGQTYPVAATMGIALEDESVRFTLRIENNTPYQLGEVFFPMLGGVTGLGNTRRELRSTQLALPSAKKVATSDIFFQFTNCTGLGDQGAEQYYLYPKDLPKPWMELFNPRLRRSVHLGVQDPADRPLVLHLEMIPGIAETPRWDGNWPRPEELHGLPAGLRISWVHFANHPPGTVYEAAPVVLKGLGQQDR